MADERLFPNPNGLVERTLNVSDIIEAVKHSLAGEAIKKVPHKTFLTDSTGKRAEQIVMTDEWVQVAHPFMTREGVETIGTVLQLAANQITMGSNLPVEKAAELAFGTDLAVISLMAQNSFKWRIDISKMRIICETLRNVIYALVFRSVDGWLLEMLTTMTSRIENPTPPPQPKPLLGAINPMRLFR